MNFKITFDNLKSKFEEYLFSLTEFNDVPSPLKDSMQYALRGEGKRIRPILFLYMYSLYKEINESALLFASALEILHNYSLVHDDLPCMDNDDYRRGRLTVHKAYGEDIGVLCGDALLNYAFEIVSKAISVSEDKDSAIKCFSEFAKLAGSSGMIGGQTVDTNPNKQLNLDTLNYIYKNKTGNLFCYSIKGAMILANQNDLDAEKFGYLLGYIFQLTDDLLDDDNAFSILNIISRKEAEELLENKTQEALLLAEKLDKNGFFTQLIHLIAKRKN